MTFKEWLSSDDGVQRFGMELRKEYISAARDGWNAAVRACAGVAEASAMVQHEAEVARSPRAAVVHSPDTAKWKLMAAKIRMLTATNSE